MVRIARELEASELFIVLSEGESRGDGTANSVCESTPGVRYVAKHALFIIAPGHLYVIRDSEPKEEKSLRYDGHEFLLLNRKEAARLVEKGQVS